MQNQARFIRKTTLAPDEYRANFTITDNDVIDTISSAEALKQTSMMPAIYLRLLRAPGDCWEREGVLRFTGDVDGEEPISGWEKMRRLAGVSNSTLSKALKWMHEQGVIGYVARKNGVGIRIFVNRAVASIRRRGAQKNLRLVGTPVDEVRTPSVGTPFKEEISKNNLDVEKNPVAPARDTGMTTSSNEVSPRPAYSYPVAPVTLSHPPHHTFSVDEIVDRVKRELNETLVSVCGREVARTREWLEKAGIPKAVRVAQHETYQVLRSLGIVGKDSKAEQRAKNNVGLGAPQFDLSREEVVRLWVDLAVSVRGIPLDELLTEYVTRGEMKSDEARTLLGDAASMGLWGDQTP